MADVTFGVKVPEELKEQISKLMSDSGLTGKDFMQQIINTYTVEKTKESIPQVAEDLKELQTLTQRINNIYLNLGYRIENITKLQQEHMQKELQSKDSIITDLQAKIEILKEENYSLNSSYSELVNIKTELNNRVNELTDNNNNVRALNEEYKNKIDTMAGIVEEYKQYKIEVEKYQKLLEDSQNKNIELNNNIKEKVHAIEKLSGEITAAKEDKEKIVRELNIKHDEKIQAVSEKAELEKEKATLVLQKQYQEDLQDLQHKHNVEIDEYQAKYRSLLEQLEKTEKNVNNGTHTRNIKTKKQDTIK